MTDNIIIGKKRRYHIESTIANHSDCIVYSSFSRRKSGKKIKRRYYAIVESDCTADAIAVDTALQQTIISSFEPIRIEEDFVNNGKRYIVIAKGNEFKNKPSRLQPLLNKGYLMVVLAAIILILVIVKYFQ